VASVPRPSQSSASDQLPDIRAALELFDETTRALEARARRLDEVLTVKQRELEAANRQLAEQFDELDRLHAWLEQVLAAVATGVVAVDQQGEVTTCNRAAREMLAGLWSPEEGKPYRSACPDAPLWQAWSQGTVVGPVERDVLADGQRRVLAGRAAPIRDGAGRQVGAVEVFEDVTELHALQRRLAQVERLKAVGEMAAGVAHEIRNPLNGIEGFASLLARDAEDGSTTRRYAEAIIDGVRHLNHTVSGLLAYTRPQEPQRHAVDPAGLLADCVELVRAETVALSGRRQAEAAEGEVLQASIEIDDDWRAAGRIRLDGTQIRQVLLNLIQNAVVILAEHRPGAGHIRIGLARSEDDDFGACCRFTIDDDGPGVPVDQRERIFLPFHTTREQGTGLGLAVVHAMVQLHGGRIEVTDSDLGGARFVLWLPIV